MAADSPSQVSSGRHTGEHPALLAASPQLQQPRGSRSRAHTAAALAPGSEYQAPGKQPVLLLDVMDTLVTDPFFEHMPRFFGLSFKELLAAKHPTAWIEFENDEIDQAQLFAKFFADGRSFDGDALVAHMVQHYEWVDGMPPLLGRLKAAGYEMHACSNYPRWYELIEAKLQLSDYLQWTFVSCKGPMKGLRKPAPAAYEAVLAALALPPGGRAILVDDRAANVEAAAACGLQAVRFGGCVKALEAELLALGLEF